MKAFFERYRPHPWHGLPVSPNDPELVGMMFLKANMYRRYPNIRHQICRQ